MRIHNYPLHYKVSCTTHQHSGSEIKLVQQLGDKDVHFHQTFSVSFLNLSDHISEPLILLLCAGDPQEVHLLVIRRNTLLSLATSKTTICYLLALDSGTNVIFVNNVLEDGREWSDTNPSSNQDGNIKLVPVLVSFSKWTING